MPQYVFWKLYDKMIYMN